MKIISTVALDPSHRTAIAAAIAGVELLDRQCRSPEDISEFVSGGCDVLLSFRMPDDILARARGLKWVQLLSAGADHALGGPMKSAAIPITTASGVHATPIAEYTLASMLAYARRFHITIRAQQRHEWSRRTVISSLDVIRGKTLGIVGYGSIGRETARLAQAFGMRVLALKRNPAELRETGWTPRGLGDPEGRIPARWFGPEQIAELLKESDYVSVTLPLTSATRKFIGAREISAMKPGAYFVNIGRGAVVDEAALAAALADGRIGGAGLDVFEHEPLEAASPLWDLEQAILTPHVSGDFRGYMELACELFAENLRRFQAGEPLLNRVDPALGY
ncbi:MAG TPA: D-2-hydroxyacid dehydrogenase [Candidatus Binataceae bacterium]|nr:D-2-hydroxyacid dehydrogenase [Candidatus Binataceae bacterium]